MTLPDERYRSVLEAKRFLEDLLDPQKTPRVPKRIRAQAKSILRHYPNSYHMQTVSHYAPDIFQEQIEPVQRMIMAYEEKHHES